VNSPPRWRQIEDLFHQALEQPESERQLWLERVCAHDTPLLAEVQSLLDSDKSTASASIHAQVADAVKATVKSLESEHLPRAVGPYRLLRQIGRGGMGTVYLAERADGEFQKRVAVKMVQPGMDTEFILGRFRRERQVLARFDHPNIGRLLDGGTMSDGIPYFVMEYIDGDWITRYCDAQKLSITKRLRLFLRVCSAVHYAHLHFVVHRDLKPGNILVDSKGQPKLLDFGICKLLYQESGSGIHHTGTLGMHLLTPEYASPEQVRGEPVTIASDLYSLGAVLYELMTGARPHVFPKLTPQVVEQVVCEQDIIAPSEAARPRSDRLARRLGGDLDNIILHAMCKEPDRRYVTVEHFAEDIRKHLSYQPVMARSDSFGYRSQKFFRRNRLWMGLSLALVLAFSAGLLSTELRTWLVPKAALDPSGPAGIHQPLSRKQQVGLLVELGDSYTQEQNWRGALAVYQQAQAQIVNSAGQVDPQMRAWSDRIRAGIKRAQEQQGRNVGK
jgi:eukaryotic-like serine/threonine-protein kinase